MALNRLDWSRTRYDANQKQTKSASEWLHFVFFSSFAGVQGGSARRRVSDSDRKVICFSSVVLFVSRFVNYEQSLKFSPTFAPAVAAVSRSGDSAAPLLILNLFVVRFLRGGPCLDVNRDRYLVV